MIYFTKQILLLLISCPLTHPHETVFLKGDASFIGIVDSESDLLTNGTTVFAAANFGIGGWLDSPQGIRLDVSRLPSQQLSSVKLKLAELIQADQVNHAVLLCFTSENFDFAKTWLGIPYNRNPFRLGPHDVVVNRFGPPGSSVLSSRDANSVTPLPVDIVGREDCVLSGKANVCILSMENSILQRTRHVIYQDGTTRQVDFEYVPKYRICFDEGDAYFIANAKPLLSSNGGDIELNYHVLPRRGHFFFHPNGKEMRLSEMEVDAITSTLPIQNKGSILRIKNVTNENLGRLRMVAEELSRLDSEPSQPVEILAEWKRSGGEWFAFVFDKNYSVTERRVSKRYNSKPLKALDRPIQFEFVDCTYGVESYPTGIERDSWPPFLPVKWHGDVAEVQLEQIKLLFVPHFDDVCFTDNPDQQVGFHYEFVDGKITKWSQGKKID